MQVINIGLFARKTKGAENITLYQLLQSEEQIVTPVPLSPKSATILIYRRSHK